MNFQKLRSSGATEIPLAQLVQKISGENVNLCYQCKKCGVGCPVAYAMDYTPIQIIHAIRLDMEDVVFKSKTAWLCASCETCTSRCPQNLDIAKIMDAVKIIVQRRNIQPAVLAIPSFYQAALNNIKFFGRLFEVGLDN